MLITYSKQNQHRILGLIVNTLKGGGCLSSDITKKIYSEMKLRN